MRYACRWRRPTAATKRSLSVSSGTASVVDVDLLSGDLAERPPLPLQGTARVVGLTTDAGDLVVAITEDSTTTLLSDRGDDDWHRLADLPTDAFTPGTRRDDYAPGFTGIAGGILLARRPRSVVAVDLRAADGDGPAEERTAAAVTIDRGCGSRSTTIIGGPRLLTWGGGSCDGSSAGASADGASIELDPAP